MVFFLLWFLAWSERVALLFSGQLRTFQYTICGIHKFLVSPLLAQNVSVTLALSVADTRHIADIFRINGKVCCGSIAGFSLRF